MNKIFRINRNQNCVISCSSSNEYAPYLCVFLQSLIENSCTSKFYDIVVLSRTISEFNKKIILEHFNQISNVSIRFFDPSLFFKNVNKINSLIGNFPDDVYNRIAAPVIFEDYDKVIFTDIDMVVNSDILQLSDTDLEGCAIGACKEPVWKVFVARNNRWKGIFLKDYAINTLGLSDPCDYYNTGLILFDVKKCLSLNSFTSILNLIKNNDYFLPEQCATTSFFYKKIKDLSPVWNYLTSRTLFNNEFLSEQYFQDYMSLETKANIYHFVHGKPWDDIKARHADIWWKYASRTPYFSSSMFDYYLSILDEQIINKIRIDRINNLFTIVFSKNELCCSFDIDCYAIIALKSNNPLSNDIMLCCIKNFLDSQKIKNLYDESSRTYKILKSDFWLFFKFVISLDNNVNFHKNGNFSDF